MTENSLREARERIGMSQQELARWLDVADDDIDEWERSNRVPRRQRYAAKLALWHFEAAAVMAASGLPECDWIRELQEKASAVTHDEVAAHVTKCKLCIKRDQYMARHMPGQPIGGGVFSSIIGITQRLPGWQRSAVAGALMLLTMAGVGVLFLLGTGIVNRDPERIAAAFALLALLALSGAAGGIVHYLTTPLREASRSGHYASWVITVYGYMFAVLALLALAGVLFGPEWSDQSLFEMFESRIGVLAFVVVTTGFGLVAGHSSRPEALAATTQAPERTSPARVLVIIGVGAVVIAIVAVALNQDSGTAADKGRSWYALEEAVRNSPDNAEFRVALALALLDVNRRSEALTELETAVRIEPEHAEARALLGLTLNRLSRYAAAVPELEAAVRIEPDHPHAHWRLAWALKQLRRYDEAADAYVDAVRVDPDQVDLLYEFGWVLLELGRLEEAGDEFRAAIRLDPADPDLHAMLGTTLMRQGKPAEGLAAYREAVDRDPQNARFWYEIARLTHFMAQYDESDMAFTRLNEISPALMEHDDTAREIWLASKEKRQFNPSDGTPAEKK